MVVEALVRMDTEVTDATVNLDYTLSINDVDGTPQQIQLTVEGDFEPGVAFETNEIVSVDSLT